MKRENSTKLLAKKFVIQKINKKYKDDYRSLIKGLGSMIIQNGLYGTLVFLKAKNKDHHKAVFNDIEQYLKEKGLFKGEDLLTFLENTEELSTIQEKVLEFTNWYRRYVDIFIQTGGE
ncbi:CRISPR-associated protein Cmr5 [Marinitoga sp. 1135]|uniref:CRISPR type III-B/RAMP module-associated protein Cmr5 n=1 Tax=Marinitoga piezophila (strain DSM 14283 / JCM 11233 / KA3) TaxID=443254 RepID=H2J4R9_MARPK|nr:MULTISPECIES: type III-B CRISPR module-associated protein Cmr5 [Marinitoga]AEX84854.1 CRISPR type III-B/RAMP module-associated protein Cmr5 [Marinitoga piezophila KA3]APT75361.1 CRISPR-associated protein Cmr5 [Marinitoga sp. 1137]NUU95091.1 CRISPR-associated protein Cmr5 [Marinitoga sp. 1135]